MSGAKSHPSFLPSPLSLLHPHPFPLVPYRILISSPLYPLPSLPTTKRPPIQAEGLSANTFQKILSPKNASKLKIVLFGVQLGTILELNYVDILPLDMRS